MSKVVPGHPGEERLLRLADGELPVRESAEVRDHLEACWECRAGMEAIQAAVADCVHYRKSVLQAHLPAPPMPWRDLSGGFAAVDRQIAGETAWWRMLWASVSAPKFWIPAVAAGLVVTLVLVPWLRVTPTVQAAELLRRAVVAAESRPKAPARKLHVRTGSKRMLRPVSAMFESARYDWNDPLSAKAYLDWHSSLPVKTDEVIPDGTSFYAVRTRSSESELTEATLRLRQGDLQPVQGMFKFRNDAWVELTEVEGEPTAVAAVPAGPALRTATPPAAPGASIADELRVLEALHRIGADLGDPVEVARTGARIEVKGFGIDGRRRAQIEEALRGSPFVNLSFVVEGAPAGIGSPASSLAVKPGSSPLQSYLEQRLGGVAAIEQFTNEIFDRDEQIMARAHAIQRLALRFPDPASLPPADLAVYHAMQRSHAQALVKLTQELGVVLRPVAPASGSVSEVGPATAQSLLQAARRLEQSLSMLSGAAPLVGEASALPDRIAAGHAALVQITRLFLENMGQ
jgi:hypothetical protein